MSINGFINNLIKPHFQPGDGLVYWRERIFNGIILAFFIFGTIAIVPNLLASLEAKMISIFIFDLLIYLSILAIVFVKRINTTIKIYVLIFWIYFLGIFLLIELGPFGPGLIWITGGSVYIALMLDIKRTVLSIILNCFIVIILAFSIYFNIADTPFFNTYKLLDWVAIGLNLVLISAACSIPIAILTQGLEKTLNEEKELKHQLIEKNQMIKEEMDKAKEADQLKSLFLAILSHEIRTPMNAISGFSELLMLEEDLSPEIKKYSEQIFINSDYLQIIINDILDISLIEAGQIKIRKEYFTIDQFMEELSVIANSLVLRKRKPELSLHFLNNSGMHKEMIFFDRNHLKQIIINFITNAIKYSVEGTIEIGCNRIENEIQFYVRDSGIGIPESEKEKIFERFIRIEKSRNFLIQGMGIGLSIVKGLSDALNGKVWLDSEENKGSCFYFSFLIEKEESTDSQIKQDS